MNEKRIALVGDTQRTLPLERLMGREINEVQTRHLFRAMAAEKLEAVILLGDLVNRGDSIKEWEFFDEALSPLRASNIPIYPVLGNHDLWGNEKIGAAFFQKRFPQCPVSRWYSLDFGVIKFVVLNSNQDRMTPENWHEQKKWFQKTMEESQADQNKKGIIVITHHPPFTNSNVTPDEVHVQQAFFSSFFGTPKAMIFMSGHAHTYERFIKDEKMFIVSGGGGGPRVKILKDGKKRHQDLFQGNLVRPFHFILMNVGENSLKISVRGCEKNEERCREIDSLTLQFP